MALPQQDIVAVPFFLQHPVAFFLILAHVLALRVGIYLEPEFPIQATAVQVTVRK